MTNYFDNFNAGSGYLAGNNLQSANAAWEEGVPGTFVGTSLFYDSSMAAADNVQGGVNVLVDSPDHVLRATIIATLPDDAGVDYRFGVRGGDVSQLFGFLWNGILLSVKLNIYHAVEGGEQTFSDVEILEYNTFSDQVVITNIDPLGFDPLGQVVEVEVNGDSFVLRIGGVEIYAYTITNNIFLTGQRLSLAVRTYSGPNPGAFGYVEDFEAETTPVGSNPTVAVLELQALNPQIDVYGYPDVAVLELQALDVFSFPDVAVLELLAIDPDGFPSIAILELLAVDPLGTGPRVAILTLLAIDPLNSRSPNVAVLQLLAIDPLGIYLTGTLSFTGSLTLQQILLSRGYMFGSVVM